MSSSLVNRRLLTVLTVELSSVRSLKLFLSIDSVNIVLSLVPWLMVNGDVGVLISSSEMLKLSSDDGLSRWDRVTLLSSRV